MKWEAPRMVKSPQYSNVRPENCDLIFPLFKRFFNIKVLRIKYNISVQWVTEKSSEC